MQQAGIDTAVCACGTALTQAQVRLLSEYADEVILSYDSDEAGQKATLRSLELFRNSPVQVGVLNIPNAKDPDEYIKKFGAERFQQLLTAPATPWISGWPGPGPSMTCPRTASVWATFRRRWKFWPTALHPPKRSCMPDGWLRKPICQDRHFGSGGRRVPQAGGQAPLGPAE